MNSLRILAIFLISSAAVSPAKASITQVIGGPGGGPFTIECPEGQAAIGVYAKAGSWVDGIGLICKRAIGNPEQVGWAGGAGGGPQEVYCSGGRFVHGIYMTFTRGNDLPRQYVNTIGIMCGTEGEGEGGETHCILSDDEFAGNIQTFCSLRKVSNGIFIPSQVDADYLKCPADEVLTGLNGRYGNYVDAIGAICGPRPRLAFLPVVITAPEKAADAKVTPADVGPAVPIDHGGAVSAAPINNPAVIPPDPIRPEIVTPVLIPSVISNIDRCRTGYVWREATADDHVCVTPESRARAAQENSAARSRVDPAGAYGPNTCISGFVWREAFAGDVTCVTPEVRALVREENAQAADRRL